MASSEQLQSWALRLSQVSSENNENISIGSIIQEIQHQQKIFSNCPDQVTIVDNYSDSRNCNESRNNQSNLAIKSGYKNALVNDSNAKHPETSHRSQINNAFINLSDLTQQSFIQSMQKIPPLIILNPDESWRDKNNLNQELAKNGIMSDDIENLKFTEAGNLLVYCKSREVYQKILLKKTLFEKDVNELKSANDDKAIIIKDLSFHEAEEIFERELKPKGITSIIEIISNKKNVHINMTKAICKSSVVALKLEHEGIKIGYIRHKVNKFILKPKLVVCFNCGQNGHTAPRCKTKSICIRCSSPDHLSKECPHVNDIKAYKCPNCNGPHPATYGGCAFFKKKLGELYDKRNNKSPPSNTTRVWSNAIRTSNSSFPIESQNSSMAILSDKLDILNKKIDEKMSFIHTSLNDLDKQLTDKLIDINSKLIHNENKINNLHLKSIKTIITAFNLLLQRNKVSEQKLRESFDNHLLSEYNIRSSGNNYSNFKFEDPHDNSLMLIDRNDQ